MVKLLYKGNLRITWGHMVKSFAYSFKVTDFHKQIIKQKYYKKKIMSIE